MTTESDRTQLLFLHKSGMFHQALTSSLAACEDLEIVAAAEAPEEAFHALERNDVDVIVIGLKLPGVNGLSLAEQFRSRYSSIPLVLLAPQADEETFLSAVRMGVEGYVLKSSPFERLLSAIRAVVAGQCNYDPVVCSPVVRRLVNGNDEQNCTQNDSIDLSGLSCRERQVVNLISKGLSNKEIARELGISMSTTKTHTSRIFKQFGISSRKELLPRFMKLGGMNNSR